MRASTKRFYSILLGIAFFAGAMYVYSNYARSAYDKVKVLKGERAAKIRLLDESQKAVEIVDTLLAKYQSLSSLQDSISRALPVGEEIPAILNQIQGLASLDGRKMEIDSISFQYLPIEYPKEKTFLRPYGAIRVSVRMRSNYADLKSFLSALQKNIRLLDISSLKIDGGGKGSNPALTFDLAVDAYYQLKN